jgi:hypothetical protein
MIRLLRYLIWGDWHQHKWELIHRRYELGIFNHYVCTSQCEHCGKIRKFKA